MEQKVVTGHMYHATTFDNLDSILENGLIKHIDGIYLCDRPDEAIRFLYIRGITHVLVAEVDLSKIDINKLRESFDHSEEFFKCKAYVYDGNISTSSIRQYLEYRL